MRIGILILLFGLLIGCTPNKSNHEEHLIIEGDLGSKLDSILVPYVQNLRELTDNSAGLAIGVTKADKIIYARTFGYSDVNQKKKTDLNTSFHLASLSKPFSAMAIAQLVQNHKLKLSDLIVNYIPEFKMQGEDYAKITIEHILTHTSGIPRNIAIDDWLNPSFGPDALNENLEIVNDLSLDFEPGTKFSYSNSGYDILGILISRVSGLPFDEYIQQKILAPAGMTHTSLKKPKDMNTSNWASSHSYGLETQSLSPYPYNERLFPSSGVVASLKDMCKWGQVHLGKGTINDSVLLNREHFNLMVTPKYDTPWNDAIGLSWFLQSYLDRPIYMHTGFDTGFESMMYTFPSENISIVVLANRDFARTGRIINAVSEVLFNEPIKEYDISARYKFAEAYHKGGIENAISVWQELKNDTLDNYFVDEEDILTSGAILENGQKWKESKEILTYYLTLDEQSTYAWRLLGNTNLNLGDTLAAITCYEMTLKINPNYEKGKIALELLREISSKD